MEKPDSLEGWSKTLRKRFNRQNRELGIQSPHAFEVFTITAWGEVPLPEALEADLPGISPAFSNLDRLRQRLEKWRNR
jgi:hypothetical protein